jgi:hypothetical protein
MLNPYEHQDPDGCVEIDGELCWFECNEDYIEFIRIKKLKQIKKRIYGSSI